MAFAIEAVRYGTGGAVTHLRWRPVIKNRALRFGQRGDVSVAEAVAAAERGHEIFLLHDGALGRLVIPHRTDADVATLIDNPGDDMRHGLSSLPRF